VSFAVKQPAPGCVLVILRGELEVGLVHDYAVPALASPHCRTVLLDVDGVTYLDNDSFYALLALALKARSQHKSFALIGECPRLHRMIYRTGTAAYLPVQTSTDEAVRSTCLN